MTQISLPVKAGQTASPPPKLTFAEYLLYQDNSDTLYELFRGKLIPMATPTGLHTKICQFLVYQLQCYFAAMDFSLVAVTTTGVRTEENSSRIPDVIVCTPQLWEQVCGRKGAGVLDFGEVPTLVVEIASENWREDYIRKRAEYALVEIPEYWIVDPKKQRIRVLIDPENEEGYKQIDFQLGQTIQSSVFPELILSVDEILSPPLVEDLIKAEQAQLRQLEQQLSQERQRAEQERQRAEQERQRAEQERQRAENLAALLREKGFDPDSI